MELYIFRHGETYFTKHDIDYGDKVVTAEILEEGIPAIKRLAKHLNDFPTDQNFSSPFKRCKQTVEIVNKITDKEFMFDDRLRDIIPEEEIMGDVIKRILEFSKELDSKNHRSVAICTHGYSINALIAYFTKGYIREGDLDKFPNPGVLSTIKDKKVSYKDFNQENL